MVPGFETLFKLKFPIQGISYANHAHSDLVQFLGEFGLIGTLILIISLSKFLFKKLINLIID